METQLCSMCQRPKATLSNSRETDREVEDILGHFEVPADSFRGSKFCPDCLKLLALTHQVSVKIRKRKQAQEEQGKSPAAVVPGRRPSNEAKLSLARRMRLAQQAARGGGLQEKDQSYDTSAASSNGSDDKHESENESAAVKDAASSHSDDEEYRNGGGECSSSFRSRTRSL